MAKKLCALLLVVSMLFTIAATGLAADAKPFEDSEFFEIGDYSIHYRFKPATGEFKGRFVLIHGLMSSTTAWEPFAEIMTAEGYDCLLVDLPNFGYSTRENVKVQAIPREDILAALMEELAPGEKWFVGGHSMGGGVAMVLASKHPDLIEALFLYAPGLNTKALFPNNSEMSLQIIGSIFNAFFKMLVSFARIPFVSQMIKKNVGYAPDFDLNRRYLDALSVENTGMGLIFMMKRATPLDVEALHELNMPIFLCLAEDDKIVPVDGEMAIKIADNLPEHTVKLIMPGLNHSFIESDADRVTAATLDFIAGLAA